MVITSLGLLDLGVGQVLELVCHVVLGDGFDAAFLSVEDLVARDDIDMVGKPTTHELGMLRHQSSPSSRRFGASPG
jgi:hypothetical protein